MLICIAHQYLHLHLSPICICLLANHRSQQMTDASTTQHTMDDKDHKTERGTGHSSNSATGHHWCLVAQAVRSREGVFSGLYGHVPLDLPVEITRCTVRNHQRSEGEPEPRGRESVRARSKATGVCVRERMLIVVKHKTQPRWFAITFRLLAHIRPPVEISESDIPSSASGQSQE